MTHSVPTRCSSDLSWNQVWFGPEYLKKALSAARRSALPLTHELSLVLNATVKPQNVLVIDSAERIEAGEFVVIRKLLQAILPSDGEETERSEERRVGEECGSTCRYRWSQNH